MDTCATGSTCTRVYTLVHVCCHSSLHVYTRLRVLPLNEAILATVERLQNGVIILLHRGRRHRRRGEALADHREDVLHGAELRVVLHTFTLPRGGGLAERRDGRLQLLHLVHPLARLQQRLLNRRGNFGPLEGASVPQGREGGLLAEAFRRRPARRLWRGRSRHRSGSESALGSGHHADVRWTRGGGRKSHGTGRLS